MLLSGPTPRKLRKERNNCHFWLLAAHRPLKLEASGAGRNWTQCAEESKRTGSFSESPLLRKNKIMCLISET